MSDEINPLLNGAGEPPPRWQGLSWGSMVLVAGVLIFVATVGWALTEQTRSQPTSGRAPDFTVTTFDGQPFTLSEQRGQIVVINFWGSWCAPCRDEAPELQAIHAEYAGRGVVLIGVTYAESSPQDSLDFIEEFGLTYQNAPDPRTRVAERYRIRGVPETFIIDRAGRVAEGGFFPGPVTVEQVRAVLDRLLAEDAA